MKQFCAATIALVVSVVAAPYCHSAEEHWVSTWATAQQLAPVVFPTWFKPPPPPPNAPGSPIPPIPAKFENQTVRMTVRTSLGGSALRIELSNAFGSEPVVIGAAHMALKAQGSGIQPASDRSITFGGQPGTTILAGSLIVSDPIALKVGKLTELSISLYLPKAIGAQTVHPLGLNTTYVASGNVISREILKDTTDCKSYFWLAGVEVSTSTESHAIVAFGDSITDGFSTTADTWRAWPSLLAAKLQSQARTAQWSVLNLGISGNRVRRDGAGLSALARFDRDVLGRPGVRWIILLEGINDINVSAVPGAPEFEQTTVEQLIEAYQAIVERAHLNGIKVAGATITPTKGLWMYNEKSEALRQGVNSWIRTGGQFDRVIDFDAATRDPSDLSRLAPVMDSGDHIHPNDAGNAAMADAIDITMFDKR